MERVTMRVAGLVEPVIDIPELTIAPRERLAVMGPSGAGKTTLINILTGLERPTTGQVFWNGVDIAGLPEAGRDTWRARNVGLVLQDFALFEGLTARDNVLLPQQLRRLRLGAPARDRAGQLLARVGIRRPDQVVGTMSRGEMQRVAVARALQAAPQVIVADEPTASLDAGSARDVSDLLVDLAQEARATLVVITHDVRLADAMERVIFLRGGRIDAAPAGRASSA
jgi:putative ABC transport system ATP-binding protein